MKTPPPDFPHLYEATLRSHLERGARADTQLIEQTGGQLRTSTALLDFAGLQEQLLVMELLPVCPARKRAAMIRNAGNFFAAVIATEAVGKNDARDATRLSKAIESLSGRTVELASANRLLGLEINRREKVETALRISEQDLKKSLEKSELPKEQLRGLSRQLLAGGNKGLGILGMRERVEMVGGSFQIETTPGKGTKITAHIPEGKTTERKWREESIDNQPEKS